MTKLIAFGIFGSAIIGFIIYVIRCIREYKEEINRRK